MLVCTLYRLLYLHVIKFSTQFYQMVLVFDLLLKILTKRLISCFKLNTHTSYFEYYLKRTYTFANVMKLNLENKNIYLILYNIYVNFRLWY